MPFQDNWTKQFQLVQRIHLCWRCSLQVYLWSWLNLHNWPKLKLAKKNINPKYIVMFLTGHLRQHWSTSKKQSMQSKWNKYKISLIFVDTLVCIFKYGFLWKVLHRRRFKELWNVPQRRLKKGIDNENNCQKYVRWKQQENQFQGTMSYEWKEDASLPTGWKLKNGVNCTYFLRWCQLISCTQSESSLVWLTAWYMHFVCPFSDTF